MSKLQYVNNYENDFDDDGKDNENIEQKFVSQHTVSEEENFDDDFFEDEDDIEEKLDSQSYLSDEDALKLAEDNLNICLYEMGLPTHFQQITSFEEYVSKFQFGFLASSFISLCMFLPFYKAIGPAVIIFIFFDYIYTQLKVSKYDFFEKISHYKILKGNFFSRKKIISKALENKDNYYSIIYYMDMMAYIYKNFGKLNPKNEKPELTAIYYYKTYLNQEFIKKDVQSLADIFCSNVYPIIEKFKKSDEYGQFLLETDFQDYVNKTENQYKKDKLTHTLHTNENQSNFENIVSFLVKGKK